MTHAMVINAVHLDDVTGLPVRWRIENSWGDAIGTKVGRITFLYPLLILLHQKRLLIKIKWTQGFMTMSDAWFDDNVFQVVAPRHKLPAHLLKVFDQGVDKATVLMPWDPMGARTLLFYSLRFWKGDWQFKMGIVAWALSLCFIARLNWCDEWTMFVLSSNWCLVWTRFDSLYCNFTGCWFFLLIIFINNFMWNYRGIVQGLESHAIHHTGYLRKK